MSVACVVQARMGSSRLPGKVLQDLGGRPMLTFLLERLARLEADHLVVATSELAGDDAVAEVAAASGATVVRGSEDDVLGRFLAALDRCPADVVVRITADCPLTDPDLIAAGVRRHLATGADYTSNTLIRTFPDGLDVEVVAASALRAAGTASVDPVEREHVTPFVYRRPERFGLAAFRSGELLGAERWTVDDRADLDTVRDFVSRLDQRSDFGWREVLAVAGLQALPKPGELILRPVVAEDAGLLLALRNDPASVHFSRTGQRVSAEEHKAWFADVVDNPGRRVWIGEVDGEAVGQVRVDVENGAGEVSIALAERWRGRGYGTAMLAVLRQTLLADHQVRRLVARVHQDNAASAAAFRRVGFEPGGADGDFQRLTWLRGANDG